MTRFIKSLVVVGLVGVLVCLASGVANAAVMPLKDSADFDWKYEMNVSPTTEDLDGHGTMDFSKGGGGAVTFPQPSVLQYNTTDNSSLFYRVADTTYIWPGSISYATGYTIEARVKILQNSGTSGFAYEVMATPSGNSASTWLKIGSGGQGWNVVNNLGLNDNSSDFHVFRVVQEPGTTQFSVWRDGIPLASWLGSAYPGSTDMYTGDGTGPSWGGIVQIDYYRFTAGAFAPIPEPATWITMWLGGLLALLLARRRARR